MTEAVAAWDLSSKLPFPDSSGVLEFGRGVRILPPDLRFEELLNCLDLMWSDFFSGGISARTLSATNLKLDNQVSATESHPVLVSMLKLSSDGIFRKSRVAKNLLGE